MEPIAEAVKKDTVLVAIPATTLGNQEVTYQYHFLGRMTVKQRVSFSHVEYFGCLGIGQWEFDFAVA
jgi:hypothetical protein